MTSVAKSLKTNAACGYQESSTKILQKYIEILSPILTKLINDCIAKMQVS